MYPDGKEPQYVNNRLTVTRVTDKVARFFKSAIARGEDKNVAQRFVLRCMMAMFTGF